MVFGGFLDDLFKGVSDTFDDIFKKGPVRPREPRGPKLREWIFIQISQCTQMTLDKIEIISTSPLQGEKACVKGSEYPKNYLIKILDYRP